MNTLRIGEKGRRIDNPGTRTDFRSLKSMLTSSEESVRLEGLRILAGFHGRNAARAVLFRISMITELAIERMRYNGVDRYINGIRSTDPEVRLYCIRKITVLLQMGMDISKTTEEVVKLLLDDDSRIRLETAQLVGEAILANGNTGEKFINLTARFMRNLGDVQREMVQHTLRRATNIPMFGEPMLVITAKKLRTELEKLGIEVGPETMDYLTARADTLADNGLPIEAIVKAYADLLLTANLMRRYSGTC